MNIDRGRKLQDDCEYQSFGSNYRPCSQPRKISIGIVVDSVAKCKSTNVNADKNASPVAENTNYGKVNSIDGRHSRERTTDLAEGNKGDPSVHDKSPWVSTKSIHLNLNSSSVHPVEQHSNLQATHETFNTSSGIKITPGIPPVQFVSHQNSKFLTNKVKEKGRNDSASESAGKFLSAAAQENMQSKASAEDKTDRVDTKGSESLRMQLRKILETVSSPKKLHSNSETVDIDAKGSRAEKVVAENNIFKASSDTIENDSHSHDPVVRRTMTRSLTRKRAPPKLQRKKPKKTVPACAQEERLEKEIFYVRGGRAKRSRDAVTGGSLMTLERSTKKKSSEAEAHGMPIGLDADMKQEQNTKCNKLPPTGRPTNNAQSCGKSKSVSAELRFNTSETDLHKTPAVKKTEQLRDISGLKCNKVPPTERSTGNTQSYGRSKSVSAELRLNTSETDLFKTAAVKKTEQLRDISGLKCNKVPPTERSTGNTQSYGKSKGVYVEPRVDTSEKDVNKTPVMENPEQLRDINELNLQENLYHSDDLAHSSLKENFNPKCDVQCPNAATKTPLERSFIGSLPRSKKEDLYEHSHTEIFFNPKSFQKFKIFQQSRQASKSNEEDISSDDAAVSEHPPTLKPKSLYGEDRHVRLSQSPSKDTYSESSEDRVHVKGFRKSPSLSPEADTALEPKFAFKPGKAFFSEKVSENEDSGCLFGHSEQSEEDRFDRAVTLFAFALQRFRSKMNSMAYKRSAEILMSAADRIHGELQNAEIQTQADLRTLTSQSKANEKHLEAIFQEQQEQLNAIYEQFKEQVNQHLQNCRSTLGRLEEHESELKATVEKQKVSKRKLLLQLEEEVETQLTDAQSRITVVHNLARDKMHQLKLVVAECLKLS